MRLLDIKNVAFIRRHRWARHFRWQGPYLIGRTRIGRVTIAVLNINDPLRVALRERLIAAGVFPPEEITRAGKPGGEAGILHDFFWR